MMKKPQYTLKNISKSQELLGPIEPNDGMRLESSESRNWDLYRSEEGDVIEAGVLVNRTICQGILAPSEKTIKII